jgi:hypothetical protein
LKRGDGRPYTSNWSDYADFLPSRQPRRGDPKVYVPMAVGQASLRMLAMVDTRATYSVVDASVAAFLGAFEDADVPEATLSTRYGKLTGRLVRRDVWILPAEGAALHLEATLWACPEWSFGHVIGYSGLLDRLRFAIDPGRNHFHFGPLEG